MPTHLTPGNNVWVPVRKISSTDGGGGGGVSSEGGGGEGIKNGMALINYWTKQSLNFEFYFPPK